MAIPDYNPEDIDSPQKIRERNENKDLLIKQEKAEFIDKKYPEQISKALATSIDSGKLTEKERGNIIQRVLNKYKLDTPFKIAEALDNVINGEKIGNNPANNFVPDSFSQDPENTSLTFDEFKKKSLENSTSLWEEIKQYIPESEQVEKIVEPTNPYDVNTNVTFDQETAEEQNKEQLILDKFELLTTSDGQIKQALIDTGMKETPESIKTDSNKTHQLAKLWTDFESKDNSIDYEEDSNGGKIATVMPDNPMVSESPEEGRYTPRINGTVKDTKKQVDHIVPAPETNVFPVGYKENGGKYSNTDIIAVSGGEPNRENQELSYGKPSFHLDNSTVSENEEQKYSVPTLQKNKEGPIIEALSANGQIDQNVKIAAEEQLKNGGELNMRKLYNNKELPHEQVQLLNRYISQLPNTRESNSIRSKAMYTKDFPEQGKYIKEEGYEPRKGEEKVTEHQIEAYKEIADCYIDVYSDTSENAEKTKNLNLSLAIKTATGKVLEENKTMDKHSEHYKESLQKVFHGKNTEEQTEGLTALIEIKSDSAGKAAKGASEQISNKSTKVKRVTLDKQKQEIKNNFLRLKKKYPKTLDGKIDPNKDPEAFRKLSAIQKTYYKLDDLLKKSLQGDTVEVPKEVIKEIKSALGENK